MQLQGSYGQSLHPDIAVNTSRQLDPAQTMLIFVAQKIWSREPKQIYPDFKASSGKAGTPEVTGETNFTP